MMIPAPFDYKVLDNFKKTKIVDFKIVKNDFIDYNLDLFFKRSELIINQNSKIHFYITNVTNYLQEEYSITLINNNISIKASSDKGLNYAFVSLYHLLRENNYILHDFRLNDKPKYEHRGIHLDSVRNFIEINEIYKILEEMSLLKLNVLHFHLSDDQGFSIESLIYPLLNSKGHKYYTQKEIKEIVEYSKIRGIDVIPEFDMPGHTTSIISAYKELSCEKQDISVGVLPGIYESVLCVSNDFVYEFIDNLFKEIIPLFKSEYFHIGGDECPTTTYQECPSCKKLYIEKSMTKTLDFQTYFNNKVFEIIRKYGKKIILWNDSFDLKFNNIDDLTIQYWLGSHNEKEIKIINKKQLPFIDSSCFHLYFDYPNVITPLKRVYKYKSKFKNLRGYESALWTERITNNEILERLLFPRILAVSEINWTYKRNYKKFLNNVESYVKNKSDLSIDRKPFWNPKGSLWRDKRYQYYYQLTTIKTNPIKGTYKYPFKVIVKFFYYLVGFSGLFIMYKVKKDNEDTKK